MASSAVRVAMYGATGETGGLIFDALVASQNPIFEITVLARGNGEQSGYRRLSERGARVVSVNLDDEIEKIAASLDGIDIVLVSIPPDAAESQISLARAAKLAGVKRFVPSSFAMALSPDGSASLQKSKERVLNELKTLSLPYTVIDHGWWHSSFIPKLPSGRTDWAFSGLPDFMINMICGTGEMKTHLVDQSDIGPLVAKIIVDERTLNQKVMANGDILTLNEIYAIVEEMTDESVERTHWPAEKVKATIEDLKSTLEHEDDYRLRVGWLYLEHSYATLIDGDNSPDGVERLGYLRGRDLYPEYQPLSYRSFFRNVLEGKARRPYEGRS